MGVCFGFLFYRSTIGKIVIIIVEPIALISKYLILSIFTIIGYPFKKLGVIIGKKVKKFIYLYSLSLEKKKRKLYNIEEEVFVFDHCKVKFPTIASHKENTHKERDTDEQK
jgi:hypothetical protein